VAVQSVSITANGSFCVKYYNLEFLYARNVTVANSKWSWLFENHQLLLPRVEAEVLTQSFILTFLTLAYRRKYAIVMFVDML
jgi:hypothetical protein